MSGIRITGPDDGEVAHLYIGYFRELRDQIAAGRPLTPDLIGETMRHYATS